MQTLPVCMYGESDRLRQGMYMDNTLIKRTADNIRTLSVAMVEKANSGHPGGAMGGADFTAVLFSEFLGFDPDDMAWPFRDRFFLDPGHLSPMLYAIMTFFEKYTVDDCMQFRQWGSPTAGLLELDVSRGVETTSGPLGMAHGMALGAAIAERFFAARFGEWTAHKTYAYISDGAIQEEVSQGVGRVAGHLGLANFIMFFDSNGIQLSHETAVVTNEDLVKKYESWGWRVETIDGHDIDRIRAALTRATEETQKPSLIIGKTILGRGALREDGTSLAGQCSIHGSPISKAGGSVAKTMANLGGNPENPFEIFADVADGFKKVVAEKRTASAQRKKIAQAWENKHPDLAIKMKNMLDGEAPQIDFRAIKHKKNSATREASGEVLSVFADTVENMIVSSADLSTSDYTSRFLEKTGVLKKGDFSGRFFQAGVAELTMALIANGLALHGGIIPVCSTFLVFSDFMKPAVRLAALMGLPVKYVWTHDSFRVGEDGSTHQPVEHEAQLRMYEKLVNFTGKRSMLVLRPGDAAETTVAWEMALENRSSPTALILSRQKLRDLPPADYFMRYFQAQQAQQGAYILQEPKEGKARIILAGNGSELGLLIDVAEELASEKGIAARVVSVISEALFREQPKKYQQEVVPFGMPVFGLTAGSPDALAGMCGPLGKVFGMKCFGASAPAEKLDEKYGYTRENIVREVESYLQEYETAVKRIAGLHT